MTYLLDDAYAKLGRGEEHFNVLQAEVARFRELRRNEVGLYRNPETGEQLFLNPRRKTPDAIKVGFGDAVTNTRAALDYLIYALAWLDSDEAQDGTQFPIADTPEAFKSALKRGRLAGLDDTHIAAIERLQPYNGGDWLILLRELSNPDKHRELAQTTTTATLRWSVDGRPKPPEDVVGKFMQRMTAERGFMEAGITPPTKAKPHPIDLAPEPPPDGYEHVDVGDGLAVEITVSLSGPTMLPTVELLQSEARTLVDAFKPEFQR